MVCSGHVFLSKSSADAGYCVRDASQASPTSAEDLHPVIATMRGWGQGPVTTLPLPHHVHDMVSGWLPMRPRDSPTIKVQYSIDRAAYADLNLPLPRLSSGHHPGRSTPTPSIADTGAQLHVVPRSLITSMQIKADSIFPLQTGVNGVANAPVLVAGSDFTCNAVLGCQL